MLGCDAAGGEAVGTPRQRKSLEQRLFEFYGEDFEKIVEPQEEYDWGKPVGKEVW